MIHFLSLFNFHNNKPTISLPHLAMIRGFPLFYLFFPLRLFIPFLLYSSFVHLACLLRHHLLFSLRSQSNLLFPFINPFRLFRGLWSSFHTIQLSLLFRFFFFFFYLSFSLGQRALSLSFLITRQYRIFSSIITDLLFDNTLSTLPFYQSHFQLLCFLDSSFFTI